MWYYESPMLCWPFGTLGMTTQWISYDYKIVDIIT